VRLTFHRQGHLIAKLVLWLAAGEMKRERHTGAIRVGPAGWAYKDWHGIVYPRPKPPGFHEAAFLADYFDTIEINVTFIPRGTILMSTPGSVNET
jgi:hypothetical protein